MSPNSPPKSMPTSPKDFIGAVEDHWQLFSDDLADYNIGPPIGFGASSIVHSCLFQPKNGSSKPIPCAIKILDLDRLPPNSLALLQRETTLMSLSKHPNVLRVRGSWMDGHKLYIALRLMSKGSAADVMHYGWPGGMEEEVVRCILCQALRGLNYLHINGFIHRDVKAANLLIDDDGTVLLGDLGVAADLTDETSHQSGAARAKPRRTTAQAALTQPQPHFSASSPSNISPDSSASRTVEQRPAIGKRKSFVGTPCWMAPELIQGKQYDSAADIWSFGITALELTQGRPPRSRENPQQVLLKTIQDPPPVLDREGGAFKYSKAFQEVVESCLVKDPSKRPTAEQLLQTSFFKGAKKPSYLIGAVLKDLPPLASRQQRRPLSNSQTHSSIESWDFATTIHSPGRRRYPDEDRLSSASEALFDMEGDPNSIDSVLSSHGRRGSWHYPNEDAIDTAPDIIQEETLEDSADVDSSPSSPSGSEFRNSGATSMTSPNASKPASHMDPLEEVDPAGSNRGSITIPRPPRSDVSDYASSPASGHLSSSLPTYMSEASGSSLKKSPSSSNRLWRKFKKATKRTSP